MSFKGTSFALSQRSVYALKIWIIAIPIVSSVSLALDVNVPVCIKTWNAPDSSHEITYCQLPTKDMLGFKYHISTLLAIMVSALNILFAVLFSTKLLKLLKMTKMADLRRENEQSNLMQFVLRNDALTIVGALSTMLGKLT